MMDMSVIVQAGGSSSRMGQDKALMQFNGEALVVRVLKRLIFGLGIDNVFEWIVVTNHIQDYTFLQKSLPVRLAADVVQGLGALGGLYTALSESRSTIVAVVACDLPFADAEILRTGYYKINDDAWDVFVPSTMYGLEPYHAVYRRNPCLTAIKAALDEGKRKVVSWFPDVRVYKHTVKDEIVFWNVNEHEEFLQAERAAMREDCSKRKYNDRESI